jgi:hypothetical protein
MIALAFEMFQRRAAASSWHLWTVHHSKTHYHGRLVRGQVWRRRDGRQWRYKKFGA